jgi:hypothetical protein
MTRRFTVGQAEAFGRQSTAPLGVARAIGRVPCRATDQSVVDVTLTNQTGVRPIVPVFQKPRGCLYHPRNAVAPCQLCESGH